MGGRVSYVLLWRPCAFHAFPWRNRPDFQHRTLKGNAMKKDNRPLVMLRRTYDIEVTAPRNGRPGYRWATGWTYTTPKGKESIGMRLNEARDAARADYPGARVKLSRA